MTVKNNPIYVAPSGCHTLLKHKRKTKSRHQWTTVHSGPDAYMLLHGQGKSWKQVIGQPVLAIPQAASTEMTTNNLANDDL